MAKKRGARLKKFTDYIVKPTSGQANTLDAYTKSPAKTFLHRICDYEDAINHCLNKFTKKADGTYNKDSQDSLWGISAALTAAIMGDFETYQKMLFGGIVEYSRVLSSFDVKKVCESLSKKLNLGIDLLRLMAYRGQRTPVGRLVADSLSGWHDPTQVNLAFMCLITTNIFELAEINDLQALWQIRHSIVHTGGWLTRPDSQKVLVLQRFGDTQLHFNNNFVNAVVRRLHRIVKAATGRVEAAFRKRLNRTLTPKGQELIDNLFKVATKKSSYLV